MNVLFNYLSKAYKWISILRINKSITVLDCIKPCSSLSQGLCYCGAMLKVCCLCYARVSASNLTQYCALMQQTIIETMEYDSVPEITQGGFRDNNRYVALYGNSDVSKTGDWVKILYQNRLLPSVRENVGTVPEFCPELYLLSLYRVLFLRTDFSPVGVWSGQAVIHSY